MFELALLVLLSISHLFIILAWVMAAAAAMDERTDGLDWMSSRLSGPDSFQDETANERLPFIHGRGGRR
jgi:hypothetical protein